MNKNIKQAINDVDNAIKQKTLELIALKNLKSLIITNEALAKPKTKEKVKK